jgi:5'(3')-deoxyribonucleotidase
MDGVLAEFQVFPLKNRFAHEDLHVDYINNDVFLHAKCVQPIKNKVDGFIRRSTYNKEIDIYILSVAPNSKAVEEKKQWLKEHYPYIKEENMYFVGSANRKIQTLQQIMVKDKLTREDVLYVDDVHEMLWEAVNIGINAIHPSKFLTDY